MMENKPAVLIVDDDEGTCRTLNLLLQWKGYHLATAGTGEAALALARQRFFNVALVDIRLPDMTGTDLLARLKKLHPDLEVLLITGYATLDSAMQAVAEGAYHYLTKPLNVDVLLAAIREALEKQRLAREKRRAEEALRQAELRYRTVADFTYDWEYWIGPDGNYIYVSPSCERITGYGPDEFLQNPELLETFVHPEDYARVIEHFQEHFRAEKPLPIEFRITARSGDVRWIEHICQPVYSTDGRWLGKRASNRDITERRQLQEWLNATHALGQKLVLSRDMAEIARSVTDTAQQMLRFPLCGLWLVHEEQNTLVRWAHTAGPETPELPPLPLDGERGITVAVAGTGEPIYLPDVSQDPRYVSSGFAARSKLCVPLKVSGQVIGVLNAESERLDAFSPADRQLMEALADAAAIAVENALLYNAVTTHREELQRLSAQLMNAQEEERRRISQELHDEIGQALTAMHINLTAVDQGLPAGYSPAVRERLEETMMLADEVLGQVREMALNLRPSMLDDIGLPLTLRWHVNRYARRVGLEAQLEIVGLEERLAPEVETVLYRLVQEALNNIAKHAQASQVRIRLERKDSIVTALVEDDGRGFDMQKMASRKPSERGVGLLGMRERVASLGGSFRIHSSPGQGARLSAEIPLPHGEGS